MYERGLSLERTAKLCRVKLQAVRRVTERKDPIDPEFFHRRRRRAGPTIPPWVHPLLSWQQRYDNLAWFVATMGRLPKQEGLTWERQCHGFLHQ